MLKEFKQFLFRGNVIDLAVGVTVGAAFSSVINALVTDFLTPLIAAVAHVPDFSGYVFSINGGNFLLGHLLNALISFTLVAFAIFFFVVRPVNMITARTKKADIEEPKTKKCNECLSEIPIEARRCAHCGQLVIIE